MTHHISDLYLQLFAFFVMMITGYQPLIFHHSYPVFCHSDTLTCRAYNIAKNNFEHNIVKIVMFYNSSINTIDIDLNCMVNL